MMKSARSILGLAIVFSLLAVVFPVQAQGTDSHYFDITKHNVRGAFWTYFQSVVDAESVLGYPITEEFVNAEGVSVQYFQRARLELRNGQAQLSALGKLMYEQGVQLNINNPLACRTYRGNLSVCFAFLEFFDAHGGLALFGYPISPFEYQGNMIVQYFENGRLEWHPANPEGQRVVMAELGTAYFYKSSEDIGLLKPVMPLNERVGSQVVSLNVSAFPWKAVTYSTDDQLIFIVVQDQTSQPVQGAIGQAKITWTTGQVQILPILTGDTGIATLSVPIVEQPYGGLVTVDVLVSHGILSGNTTTSFRIWY